MTFTDEDLKQLKGDIENGLWLQTIRGRDLTAILAHLEAAESVVKYQCMCAVVYCHDDSCEAPMKTQAWLKAAGK